MIINHAKKTVATIVLHSLRRLHQKEDALEEVWIPFLQKLESQEKDDDQADAWYATFRAIVAKITSRSTRLLQAGKNKALQKEYDFLAHLFAVEGDQGITEILGWNRNSLHSSNKLAVFKLFLEGYYQPTPNFGKRYYNILPWMADPTVLVYVLENPFPFLPVDFLASSFLNNTFKRDLSEEIVTSIDPSVREVDKLPYHRDFLLAVLPQVKRALSRKGLKGEKREPLLTLQAKIEEMLD